MACVLGLTGQPHNARHAYIPTFLLSKPVSPEKGIAKIRKIVLYIDVKPLTLWSKYSAPAFKSRV